jgi:hypothetical protein
VPYSDVLEVETDVLEAKTFLKVETKPQLDSLDSGHEFSLAHLLELYRLVEAEDRERDGYVFDDSCLRVA